VTTDANGNLASDGGAVFDQLSSVNQELATVDRRLNRLDQRSDENQSGVALAMAIQNPELTGNQTFGMATNWGNFEGANALGLSMIGVLASNVISQNDQVAISGGFGVGFDYGQGDNVYGGRVGLQWAR
jgi:hypothetical protein